MLNTRFPEGDLVASLREFLDVVDSMNQRVVICLGQPGLKHMEDNLGIFGIIFIPGVEHGFACPGSGYGADELQIKASLLEIMGQGVMVVSSRFEPDFAGHLQLLQIIG